MVLKVKIFKSRYYDSVKLLNVSKETSKLEGIEAAFLVMATDANKNLLKSLNLMTDEVSKAGNDDLVIAVKSTDETLADKAMNFAERMLLAGEEENVKFESLEEALFKIQDANIVMISTPGRYVFDIAKKALEHNLNVFIFSDNVPLGDEIELKKFASSRGLLCMGPGCGTSIFYGKVLGFGNVIKEGNIGIVGASGTGIQEISVLIDRHGGGITSAIGTGSNDLTKDVGGLTTKLALKLLGEDDTTKVIVVVAKLPDVFVAQEVLRTASSYGKPVVACFLGLKKETFIETGDNVIVVDTLEDAANYALKSVGMPPPKGLPLPALEEVNTKMKKLRDQQIYIRGIFSGGSLCYESQLIISKYLGKVFSNSPIRADWKLEDPMKSKEHTCVDMGAEEFTEGRAHPMIDPTLVKERIIEECKDPNVGVILFDTILGYGCHRDPASELCEAIRAGKVHAGGEVIFVTSVCGTEKDPQGYKYQIDLLKEQGVIVANSNAMATMLAVHVISRGKVGVGVNQ
ncbi:MAG: acyl-CoA synthetase FdrA [Candidatus Methanomethylicia archaeon]|jgi:FdrA protein|nr:acyl-CoA synthetase FdrA [Candidatus Methanomethylicia archaeon]